MKTQTIKKWHHTKLGLLVIIVVELILAYLFGSLSIDRGNLWWYLLTVAFLVGAINHFIRFIGKFFNGDKATKA